MERVGVLTRTYRASVLDGKESNLYRFTFEGIRFNRRGGLSNADYAKLKLKISRARDSVIDEMKKASKANKSGRKTATISTPKCTASKPQKLPRQPCAVTGSEGATISTPRLPISTPKYTRSNTGSVPIPDDCTDQSHGVLNKSQKQRQHLKNI